MAADENASQKVDFKKSKMLLTKKLKDQNAAENATSEKSDTENEKEETAENKVKITSKKIVKRK